MEFACHDDSVSDNQSPTLQEQITALAKASNCHNANLLKLNTLNAEVHEIKISLAENMDFLKKALRNFSDASPITSVDGGDAQYIRKCTQS